MATFGEGVSVELAMRLMKRLDKQGERGEDPYLRRSQRSPQRRSQATATNATGVGHSAKHAALLEQFEQAKKERDDALKQIRDIQEEACRENAKRNREINEFRVEGGHAKAKFHQLEACVQSLNRSNTDFMRRQISLEEAKTEIQAELRKSQAMVQRLQNEVNMAKQPTESMREEVAKMRSRLSEVIKTKLLLEQEVAAARERENKLQEDLREKIEKKSLKFPSCVQFDMTAEDPGDKDDSESASGPEVDEFDLEFTYEDATDLASYFPIARVASIGKRSSDKVHHELTSEEADTILGELQDVVLELKGEKNGQAKVLEEEAVQTPELTEQDFDKIVRDLQKTMDEVSGTKEEPNVALKAIDVEETQKVDTKPQGVAREEPPMPVVSGLALLSPYSRFYKYANASR